MSKSLLKILPIEEGWKRKGAHYCDFCKEVLTFDLKGSECKCAYCGKAPKKD
jgi:hypothetical protein